MHVKHEGMYQDIRNVVLKQMLLSLFSSDILFLLLCKI